MAPPGYAAQSVILIDGPRGCGKSGLLNHVSAPFPAAPPFTCPSNVPRTCTLARTCTYQHVLSGTALKELNGTQKKRCVLRCVRVDIAMSRLFVCLRARVTVSCRLIERRHDARKVCERCGVS